MKQRNGVVMLIESVAQRATQNNPLKLETYINNLEFALQPQGLAPQGFEHSTVWCVRCDGIF